MGPHILTQLEGICFLFVIVFTSNFCMACIRLRPPGPTLVPGVFGQFLGKVDFVTIFMQFNPNSL